MNATVKEWVDMAEKDFATARRELQVQEDPNFDTVSVCTPSRAKH